MSFKKYILLSCLGVLLLLLGTFQGSLYALLDKVYDQGFHIIGLKGIYESLSRQAFNLKTFTFILIHGCICLGILMLLFSDPPRRKIILRSYMLITILSFSFALIVKLTGDGQVARKLSRNIIDLLLLSPLPVILLAPILTLLNLTGSRISRSG